MNVHVAKQFQDNDHSGSERTYNCCNGRVLFARIIAPAAMGLAYFNAYCLAQFISQATSFSGRKSAVHASEFSILDEILEKHDIRLVLAIGLWLAVSMVSALVFLFVFIFALKFTKNRRREHVVESEAVVETRRASAPNTLEFKHASIPPRLHKHRTSGRDPSRATFDICHVTTSDGYDKMEFGTLDLGLKHGYDKMEKLSSEKLAVRARRSGAGRASHHGERRGMAPRQVPSGHKGGSDTQAKNSSAACARNGCHPLMAEQTTHPELPKVELRSGTCEHEGLPLPCTAPQDNSASIDPSKPRASCSQSDCLPLTRLEADRFRQDTEIASNTQSATDGNRPQRADVYKGTSP